MATNHLTISDKEDNYFEFGVETQGIDTSDMRVLFSIHDDGIEFTFPAKKKQGDMWGVTVPKMPQLKRKKYPFVINVISEGFFFEPLKGDITVVGERGVKVSFEPGKKASTPKAPAPKKVVRKEGSPAQKKVEAAKKKAADAKNKVDTDKIVQQAIDNISKGKPGIPPEPSPIKEPEKKETKSVPKKEEPKKDEPKKEEPKKESILPPSIKKGRVVSGSEMSERDKKIAAILAEETKPIPTPTPNPPAPTPVVEDTGPKPFRRVTEEEQAERKAKEKKQFDIDALLAEMENNNLPANPAVKFRKVDKD